MKHYIFCSITSTTHQSVVEEIKVSRTAWFEIAQAVQQPIKSIDKTDYYEQQFIEI